MADSSPAPTIREAVGPEDLDAVRSLFTSYVEWLGLDLKFQDFATELASLPGKYDKSANGALLLLHSASGSAIGCVALRALASPGVCEMKRLYVIPEGRGTGAGKMLAEEVIRRARQFGYTEMRLDTLPHMEAARAMYKQYGFVEIPAYYNTPLEGTIFLGLDLHREPLP